ncbi:MAG: sensor histidine kinase [Nannocystaceae bacterium]|nr:PAS domain-containing protein [bacterium]
MSSAQAFEPDYRRFVRSSHDMLAVASLEGRFLWLNDAWSSLGWSQEELLARPFMDFVHPDDVAATAAELSNLAEGNPAVGFINRYRTQAGSWRYLEWNSWVEGEHVYAHARDVTQLRQMLATARRQVETLELAEEMGNFGHWVVDLDTQNLQWSPNVFRIHGYEPGSFEPTLENGIDAYHPDDRERVQRYVETAMGEKTGWDFRLRLIRADGEERLVHAVGKVETDDSEERNVTGIFGVFQDITERERMVLERYAELEQFAYAAAHDLQAPLRTMMGFLELLEDELGETTSPDVQEYLTRLSRTATRMRSLVSELYRYAKVVGRDTSTAPVDLREVVRAVLQEREADLRSAGAEVHESGLPSVLGAAGPLSSVFANLVDNAIKYRDPDRPLRLDITAKPDDAHILVEVTDNGVGFDAAHAQRVFGLFKQLDPAGPHGGMGVGLALCKKVMQRHGGTISAEPRPGEGTTFRLRFPRAAAS